MKHKKPHHIPGFRSILLAFSLSMLTGVLAVVLVLFTQLYSVIGDMESRIEQYIILDKLSGELRHGKESFMELFSLMEKRDLAQLKQAAADSAFFRYRALLEVRSLQSDYEKSPEKYFLNRGIVNGLEFINDICIDFENDAPVLKPETYTQYYRVLKVYDYLLNYANNLYLSAAVADDVNASLDNMAKIRNLKITSGLLLFFIVICSSICAIIITKYLAGHVKEMVYAADTITQGNFTTPDLELSGPREFINLKDRINHMKHSLDERIELEKKLHAQALEHEKITRELERARYLSLQAQINPHFLFNTLNVISHTALFEHADSTVRLINSLSSVFRYRLEFKDETVLSAELEFVRQYLDIQKARFGERLSYTISCGGEFAGFSIPPFVIQPFVENAVIHGIEPAEDGGSVTVTVKKATEQRLVIRIEDNGIGIPENFSVPQAGRAIADGQQHIGIANVEIGRAHV